MGRLAFEPAKHVNKVRAPCERLLDRNENHTASKNARAHTFGNYTDLDGIERLSCVTATNASEGRGEYIAGYGPRIGYTFVRRGARCGRDVRHGQTRILDGQ